MDEDEIKNLVERNTQNFHFSYYLCRSEMSHESTSSCLNEIFFERILQEKSQNPLIKVDHVKIEPCGAASDGFLSTLLRAHVDYHMNTTSYPESFVVKTSSNEEINLDVAGSKGLDVQDKEMLFFETIAPQMVNALGRIYESEIFLPKVFSVNRKHDIIVLEDLKTLNFVLANRLIGLDEAHVMLGLKKLARFHATSLIIHKQNPKAFESFNIGMFNRKVKAFNDVFINVFKIAADEISAWPGFESYATKMKNIEESFIESATRCFDVESDDFCVLNHGDIWTNNLMFQYADNGQVEDAILVRLQKIIIELNLTRKINSRSIFNSVSGTRQL